MNFNNGKKTWWHTEKDLADFFLFIFHIFYFFDLSNETWTANINREADGSPSARLHEVFQSCSYLCQGNKTNMLHQTKDTLEEYTRDKTYLQ